MIDFDKRINLLIEQINDFNELIELHEEHIKRFPDDPHLKISMESVKRKKSELINELNQIHDIKSNKSLDGECYPVYDYEYDILSIKRKNDPNSETDLKLRKGVILYFNNNEIPVSLVILNASKLFNVSKFNLKNIKNINMSISINKKQINLSLGISINIHNRIMPKSFEKTVNNSIDAPIINTELVAI
jgi:hypothetical protein